jgi:glycosyltransferase involved in cell wall biosynthesis
MRGALEIVFWLTAGLIVWTQLGYALTLAVLARPGPDRREPSTPSELPLVALIVAAHDEQASIAAKVANALALDYPRERLEVIVACDGCADETAELARMAGADLVLELPRGGKIRAQDAAAQRARGEIVAFSDANSLWEPAALRVLVAAFAEEDTAGDLAKTPRRARTRTRAYARRGPRRRVGYACGQVRFVQAASGASATNQEGLYWRYEMAVRARESRLSRRAATPTSWWTQSWGTTCRFRSTWSSAVGVRCTCRRRERRSRWCPRSRASWRASGA